MCGRIKQDDDPALYFDYTRWNPLRDYWPHDYHKSVNVPPGTRPLVLHRLGDGAEHADCLFWGYKPPWPGYKRGPASNARLDTVLKGSPFWRPLLTRRIIVPCDGWYEWTGEKGEKQPWYINPKDGQPILMAGITAWQHGADVLAETGFATITDDASGGLVDIHDRRPICLTVDDALAWLDPGLEVKDALGSLPRRQLRKKQPAWWGQARSRTASRGRGRASSQCHAGRADD